MNRVSSVVRSRDDSTLPARNLNLFGVVGVFATPGVRNAVALQAGDGMETIKCAYSVDFIVEPGPWLFLQN